MDVLNLVRAFEASLEEARSKCEQKCLGRERCFKKCIQRERFKIQSFFEKNYGIVIEVI